MSHYKIAELEPPRDGKIGEWPLGYRTRRTLVGTFRDLTTAWNYCFNRRAHQPPKSDLLYAVMLNVDGNLR